MTADLPRVFGFPGPWSVVHEGTLMTARRFPAPWTVEEYRGMFHSPTPIAFPWPMSILKANRADARRPSS